MKLATDNCKPAGLILDPALLEWQLDVFVFLDVNQTTIICYSLYASHDNLDHHFNL